MCSLADSRRRVKNENNNRRAADARPRRRGGRPIGRHWRGGARAVTVVVISSACSQSERGGPIGRVASSSSSTPLAVTSVVAAAAVSLRIARVSPRGTCSLRGAYVRIAVLLLSRALSPPSAAPSRATRVRPSCRRRRARVIIISLLRRLAARPRWSATAARCSERARHAPSHGRRRDGAQRPAAGHHRQHHSRPERRHQDRHSPVTGTLSPPAASGPARHDRPGEHGLPGPFKRHTRVTARYLPRFTVLLSRVRNVL